MITERATALRSAMHESLRAIVNGNSYVDGFICTGSTYRQALPDLAAIMPAIPMQIASGSIGRQLGTLHDWLYRKPPGVVGDRYKTRTPRIRGLLLNISVDEVLAIARHALDNDQSTSRAFHSWYVSVDDQRVAPKWLVSRLTGLPVSAFSTDEARRVLTQIGIGVQRL